jgi:hypothetical protein
MMIQKKSGLLNKKNEEAVQKVLDSVISSPHKKFGKVMNDVESRQTEQLWLRRFTLLFQRHKPAQPLNYSNYQKVKLLKTPDAPDALRSVRGIRPSGTVPQSERPCLDRAVYCTCPVDDGVVILKVHSYPIGRNVHSLG